MTNDKIWNCEKSAYQPMSDNIKQFMQELETLCRKYDMSISHEDTHGAFVIESFSEEYMTWFKSAYTALP